MSAESKFSMQKGSTLLSTSLLVSPGVALRVLCMSLGTGALVIRNSIALVDFCDADLIYNRFYSV
jgi:hypothetical protein